MQSFTVEKHRQFLRHRDFGTFDYAKWACDQPMPGPFPTPPQSQGKGPGNEVAVTWKIKEGFADVITTVCHMGSKLLSTNLKLSRETN